MAHKRANAILPIDFFAFLVGAAGIADGHFENSAASLGQLDREFGLDVKGGAFERDALQQIGAHHFVAGFHVREIQVANKVAEKGEKFVSDRMAEEQGAFVPTGHKSRTEHSVRILSRKILPPFSADLAGDIPGLRHGSPQARYPHAKGRFEYQRLCRYFFHGATKPRKILGPASEVSSAARNCRIASAVPSVDASSTTIILIDSSNGDSLRTRSRPRLVSIKILFVVNRNNHGERRARSSPFAPSPNGRRASELDPWRRFPRVRVEMYS